nr:cytochrome c biogenesis protein CcdA [Desulfobacterales bacterium]
SFSFFARFLIAYKSIISRIGGLLIILFGLFILGVIKPHSLMKEKKIDMRKKPLGFLGSFLVGVTFAMAWTPCVGPILSSILIIASLSENLLSGVRLLFSYSLGLAIPFFILSIATNYFLETFKRMKGWIPYINKGAGILLIVLGLLVFSNYLTFLSRIFARLAPF